MPLILIDEQECGAYMQAVYAGVFSSTGKATQAVDVAFQLQRQDWLRKAERSSREERAKIEAVWLKARLTIKGQPDETFIWEYFPETRFGWLRLIPVAHNSLWVPKEWH
jgi:hypothetical protein